MARLAHDAQIGDQLFPEPEPQLLVLAIVGQLRLHRAELLDVRSRQQLSSACLSSSCREHPRAEELLALRLLWQSMLQSGQTSARTVTGLCTQILCKHGCPNEVGTHGAEEQPDADRQALD